jgi:SynChlorMet cassette radical SAM/SPASM protein ScmE
MITLPLVTPAEAPVLNTRSVLADWVQPVRNSGPVRVIATPRKVDIAITGRCNLRCKTCYYADEMVALSDLPTPQWLRLFDELGELGVLEVNLTGGEPMTHPDILRFIDALVRNRMRFHMNSNGMLFTPEVARTIKATGRCNGIQISIDGSCPEVHDRIRGHGSFVRVLRGLQTLRDAGVPVEVRVTINRLNLADLPRIFDLLVGELQLPKVTTNEAFPRGAAQCNLKDLDMTPEERREAQRVCMAYADKYPCISALAGPLALGRELQRIAHEMQKAEAERGRPGGYLSGCSIARESLAILHDGNVVPCLQLPHMVLGKVGVDPLLKIWRDAAGLHYLRTRHLIPLGDLDECRDCKYRQFCRGGCPAVGYALTGKMTGRNPRDCFRALLGEDPDYVF